MVRGGGGDTETGDGAHQRRRGRPGRRNSTSASLPTRDLREPPSGTSQADDATPKSVGPPGSGRLHRDRTLPPLPGSDPMAFARIRRDHLTAASARVCRDWTAPLLPRSLMPFEPRRSEVSHVSRDLAVLEVVVAAAAMAQRGGLRGTDAGGGVCGSVRHGRRDRERG
ncbi:hypothetical protein BRADI_1g33420v3 [Brachypodium distachyon]|uniref:Uncharacterized protein n=1 Tax=Brachypodium distachyon TaxID=15368 RepID=I1GWF3_BRADI|nr:hypothetical protein BRADI_1g33420v3 [Brachypodium distachyon]